MVDHQPLIGIVGPCGAGKSSLLKGLQERGFKCRHIAQEHSYVPAMWQIITKPDYLIYLNASFETCTKRRDLNWTRKDYEEQLRRLAHSRSHANLVIETDLLNIQEVLAHALTFLNRYQ